MPLSSPLSGRERRRAARPCPLSGWPGARTAPLAEALSLSGEGRPGPHDGMPLARGPLARNRAGGWPAQRRLRDGATGVAPVTRREACDSPVCVGGSRRRDNTVRTQRVAVASPGPFRPGGSAVFAPAALARRKEPAPAGRAKGRCCLAMHGHGSPSREGPRREGGLPAAFRPFASRTAGCNALAARFAGGRGSPPPDWIATPPFREGSRPWGHPGARFPCGGRRPWRVSRQPCRFRSRPGGLPSRGPDGRPGGLRRHPVRSMPTGMTEGRGRGEGIACPGQTRTSRRTGG